MALNISTIKKNSNEFSFISTFFELVGNKEFKKAEVDTLYNNVDSNSTSIWRSLSAIADTLGSTFYSNILNFLDNVENVDTCKVVSLQSIIDHLGVKYSVFNDIQYMPLDIRNILDILSMKREYLVDNTVVDKQFIETQMSSCYYNDLSVQNRMLSICNEINESRASQLIAYSDAKNYYNGNVQYLTCLSDEQLDLYAYEVYCKLLKDKIEQTYNDVSLKTIYVCLSNEILLSDFTLQNSMQSYIQEYKLLNNIPASFNVDLEVDKIEEGKTTISDYTLLEYGALSIEIARRKEPLSPLELKTRYKYYREKEVQLYTDFIQNEYNSATLQSNYALNSRYEVDPKYIEVHQKTDIEESSSESKLFYKDPLSSTIKYHTDMLSAVALQLVQMTKTIREIREQTKVQCQKHFMYGTKMFLVYVIREYLKNNVVQSLKAAGYLSGYQFSLDDTEVGITEYVDCTDYSNISTDNDVLISASGTNPRYWNSDGKGKAIGAINTTDLYAALPLLELNNSIFSKSSLSSFYIDILENKFDVGMYDLSTQVDSLNEFLRSLFDAGAENTFMLDNIVQTYDSDIARREYEELCASSTEYISSLGLNYKIISVDIPLLVDQDGTTISAQLKEYEEAVLSINTPRYSQNEVRNAIANIRDLTLATQDIMLVMPLSNMYHELSYKYLSKCNAKLEAYQNALMTDSYVRYLAYKNTETYLDSLYTSISTSYWELLSFNEVYHYAFNLLEVSNKPLSSLLSSISCSLPLLISNDIVREISAYDKLYSLSDSLCAANELSSEIEFTLLLETLSAQYYDMIGQSKNNYNDIRNDDIYKYRQTLYSKYTSSISNDVPYYYLNNKVHPSYALHPYLQNYSEKTSYSYPVANMNDVDNSTIAQTISARVREFVDDEGYSVSVQFNPLNNNTDYLTRYEYETFFESNNKDKSVVNSYDGFAYPRALHEFEKLSTYTISVYEDSEDGPKLKTYTENFIGALSGLEIDGLYYSWNPWYSHLDLTKNERQRIAKLLSVFRNDIFAAAYSSKDIYRYGIDMFKNTYCLLKTHNNKDKDEAGNEIDDIVDMKNSEGTMWMRYKDHPIALPMYVLKKNNYATAMATGLEYDIDNTVSLITDSQNSNLEYKKLSATFLDAGLPVGEKDYKTPLYQDFTFSNDKNIMVLNGFVEGSKASYPIIANISKQYDAETQINAVCHYKASSGDLHLALTGIDSIRSKLSDWQFETYFYDNACIGTVYSAISVQNLEEDDIEDDEVQFKYKSDISIQGCYYEFGARKHVKDIKPKLVDSISSNLSIENVCVDTNKWNVTIAYLVDLPKDDLSNYISKKVDLGFMSATYNEDYYDYVVKTKEYCVGEYEFKDVKTACYSKYTDIGCYGLMQLSNNLGNTNLGKYEIDRRGVYCFLMITEPKEKPIDFRQTIPLMMYEGYKHPLVYDMLSTPATLCACDKSCLPFLSLNLLCAHYLEPGVDSSMQDLDNYSSLTSDTNIFDPTAILKIFDGRNPYVRISEEFALSIQKTMNVLGVQDPTEIYSMMHYPWPFISSENADFPLSQYYTPYNRTYVTDDNCMFKLNESASFPYISASWFRYKDALGNDQILLDFNTMFNKLKNDKLSVNTLNFMNLFLNLEKSGDAGYLRVFEDPLGNSFSKERAKLYIKNISDNKPKFLLSVYNELSIEYIQFRTEEDPDPSSATAEITCFVLEGEVGTYIVNEYVR